MPRCLQFVDDCDSRGKTNGYDSPIKPFPARQSEGWRPERCDRIALVLQGGGALGAYQAGVYQALHEADIEPDWVSGVSIGAHQCRAHRRQHAENGGCRGCANSGSASPSRKIWHYTPDGDIFRQMRNAASSFMTLHAGPARLLQAAHPMNPWMSPAGAATATSYYDSAPLRETLAGAGGFLPDQRAQGSGSRSARSMSLTGNFVYFDNRNEEIGPEHIMASGALPPALPMVKIGTDYFWDGGIVSNTPLQHLLEQDDDINTLVFQVDLFSARGALPRDMPGRAGPPQGHHVFVAHPPQHRRLPQAAELEDAHPSGAGAKFPKTC